MVQRVTGGKALPAEVVQQMVAKTDGVPLFVEELTKTVLEAGWLQEQPRTTMTLTGPLPALAIPATLQDALRARLDRLTEGKAVAQLGAVLGRTFAYELLRAVAPLDELALWRGLVQLVQAEVLYQRGVPPQATYTFKHALHPGGGLSVAAQEHAAAVPPAHCPGVGGAAFPTWRRRSPSCWRSTTPRRALGRAGRCPTGSGPGNAPSRARRMRKRSAPHHGAGGAGHRARDARRATSTSWTS